MHISQNMVKRHNLINEKLLSIEEEISHYEHLDQGEEMVFSIMSTPPTHSKVAGYYSTNLKQANKIRGEYNALRRLSTSAANTYRNTTFVELVKTGGSWDLKVKLGTKSSYLLRGTAIGYGSTTLKTSAGLYQIISGTSSTSFWRHYFDDPADQVAIDAGIKLYNSGVRF